MGSILIAAGVVLFLGVIFSAGLPDPVLGVIVTGVVVLFILAIGLPIASALEPRNTTELVCEIGPGHGHYSRNTQIVTSNGPYILDPGTFAGKTYVDPYRMGGAFTIGRVYKITYHVSSGLRFATSATDLGVQAGQTCG